MLLKDTCETAARIMAGELDGDLGFIAQAVQARKQRMFRKGARVRLVGTRNPSLEGAEGRIIKVNQRTITVGVWSDELGFEREFNVDPPLLELVS